MSEYKKTRTYRELYSEGQKRLSAAGLAEAGTDARLLLLFVTGMRWNELLLRYEEAVPEEPAEAVPADDADPAGKQQESGKSGIAARYLTAIDRRAAHVPLQYITREQNFCGLDLYVDERVLIPRQDTETLVELVLQERGKPVRGRRTQGVGKPGTPEGKKTEGGTVLDLCTGSGCIAVALAKLGRFAAVSAADISADALAVAAENVRRTGADVTLIRSDLFSEISGKFDVITANPPYIQSKVIDTLTPEVREHEPRLALDGDGDGLAFYRRLASECPAHLDPGGSVYFEIGYDQGEAVCALLRENGFSRVRCVKDLAGLDRVVTGVFFPEEVCLNI